ncbi:MAG: restriction endonuclease subunit S [Rubrivivax sp.]|nr:restriction endonuclease subunit S [Rubrivivax sp.]
MTDFQEGPGILAKDFRNSGVPLLRLRNIETPAVQLGGCNFLDPELVARRWRHFGLAEGDFLISTSASLGRVSVVGPDAVGAIPYTGIIRFRSASPKLHHKYLRAFLSSSAFIQQAEQMATGSVIRHFGPSHLRQMAIALPPLDEQLHIAEVFDVLDARVALLRETNTTLEAIAQALFKSWFVDFDPIRAKQEGRAPEGIDEATAALFPEGFEESGVGPVPKGWPPGTLNDLAALNSQSWSARTHPERVRYLDLANVKANEINAVIEFAFEEAPSRARRALRSNDTLVGTVRPGNRSFAFIDKPVAHLTASTGFAVLSPRAVENTAFVYLSATQDLSIERLAHVADGGAYPAVRPDVVSALACVVPPTAVLCVFNAAARPLLEQVSGNQRQAQTLVTLRDTLLPRLISGQLRLPEAAALMA